jgi:carboxypeptidase Taq
LLGALHETGHAMYDLGLPQEWRDQPVGRDRGMALEESQSLLLEMVVGRSRPFLRYLKPLLEKHFAVSGPEWEIENLYRHLIMLRRGLIRVDADELTYPLHIMLRYELERRLLAGELAVKELPEAWNASMEAKLGVRPGNDTQGCLQDIHWAVGSFGYFPSYALGAMIAAQLHAAMLADQPGIEEECAAGKFATLFDWLRRNVHGLGAKLSVQDLIKKATGKRSIWSRSPERRRRGCNHGSACNVSCGRRRAAYGTRRASGRGMAGGGPDEPRRGRHADAAPGDRRTSAAPGGKGIRRQRE